MQRHAKDFQDLNTEVIVIYREEEEGVEGLKKIQEAVKPSSPPFRLALDLNKKSTKDYSPRRMTFHTYVLGSDGKVHGVIEADLRRRAKPEQILKILKAIPKS